MASNLYRGNGTVAGKNSRTAVGNQGLSNKMDPFSRNSRRNPVRWAAKNQWRHRFAKKRGTRYIKGGGLRAIAATQ